jgi:hypothetical protein
MRTYRCPRCLSSEVHRSSRRGLFETAILAPILIRPYRCWCCLRRHYGFALRRPYLPVPRALLVLTRPAVLQSALLLSILIGVPFVLADPGPVMQMIGRLAVIASPSEPGFSSNRSAILDSPNQSSVTFEQPGLPPFQVSAAVYRTPPSEAGGPAQQNPPSADTGPQRQAAGALRTSGDVYINGSKAPLQATVFYGDVVRTGPGANAVLTVTGRGMIVMLPETEISFGESASGAYFASLRRGAAGMHSLANARSFEIQVGGYLVTSGQPAEASAADIERAADGSGHVKAVVGSIGIVPLRGPEGVFIQAGQEVTISADGRLLPPSPVEQATTAGAEPGPEPGPGPAVPETGVGGTRTPWVLLGAVGVAAGIAAAVAAGGGGGHSNPSPSAP